MSRAARAAAHISGAISAGNFVVCYLPITEKLLQVVKATEVKESTIRAEDSEALKLHLRLSLSVFQTFYEISILLFNLLVFFIFIQQLSFLFSSTS